MIVSDGQETGGLNCGSDERLAGISARVDLR